MAKAAKLGRATDQRLAILRNQVSYLLWNGRIETTVAKAKAVRSASERILTLAINSYEDVVKVEKEVVNAKGVKVKRTVLNDGPAKLAARRKLMGRLYELQEIRTREETKKNFKARTKNINHPLIEKVFNELAPRYAKRIKEVGQGGGYTRILKTGARRGDNAEMAIVELV